ncbi:MAG TPA: multicopper oxidase domain-containing protein [Geodermatophilus sp.]|nr:multicopper oxidase domain-containing protein [Geodermatophilus sp.]
MISLRVPAMSSRQSVRTISARVCDVPGVQTLEVDLAARTVRVTGPVEAAAVSAAVAAAGYAVENLPLPAAAPTGGTTVDTFATDTAGLPEATRPEIVELADGAVLDLRLGPVAKRLGGTTVRMLTYNGSVPGPTLRVRQGSEIVVRVTNDADVDTTVHWHGLRLENRYDGVPHETQAPIPVGGSFTYRISFPDPGLYWYHPHIREDYTQEMGLYGTILVAPAEPDYWPPAHRDVVLTLDDVLIEDGAIEPFSRTTTTHAAMGRFGNVLLVDGEPGPELTARAGEVVRLWLVNTANARVFDVRLPGARMKLVGGDSGRTEHEEFVPGVLLGPSERAVVDVLFDRPGPLALEHRTPDRTYRLATVTVTDEPVEPPLREAFEVLRRAPELEGERQQLDRWLAAPPDKILAAVAEMDDTDSDMGHHMDLDMHHAMGSDMGSAMVHGGSHQNAADPGSGAGDGIEWEDDMVEMNRATTPATVRWKLLDRTAGGDGPPVGWRFTAGERVKIRLVNEMDSDHPMHHPIHLHGAGRFLVLARDGAPEPNLVWKDTVLLRRGETVDILFDVTNPGTWMAHCHIPEHMHSGMMFGFTVDPGVPA